MMGSPEQVQADIFPSTRCGKLHTKLLRLERSARFFLIAVLEVAGHDGRR
jgi:hypothetical protein